MWFRYERGLTGWCPVVLHERAKPTAPKHVFVTEAWPVPTECLSDDGSPMFGRLKQMFPEPEEAR